ncbi:dTDP-4-dehydrorhamnose reductase [Anaeromicropila populeti]|nr:dTDP-4-dehydrorhamnose reductase [Anaeromicropila populeti]
MITGANGQLGRALNGILMKQSRNCVINTDYVRGELPNQPLYPIEHLDITEQNAVETFIEKAKPDVVINCAAHTQVEKCEADVKNAVKINELGPYYLAVAAKKSGARLVQVSTDYVFDGEAGRPYVEEDITNPVSVYGKTKLAGELLVQKHCSQYFIVRTAWLYGDGNNFVKTMLRLSETNQEIRVVKDQFGTPTSAYELAKLILFLIETEDYGIYHGTCEGSTSWYEFAKEIFKLSEREPVLIPVKSEEYPAKVKRPKYSVLENHRLNTTTDYRMKEWKEALRDYLDSLKNGGEQAE